MILLVAFPGMATAQSKQRTGSIRYNFLTLLIPDQTEERSRTIKKNDPWFLGKAVPVNAVVLDAPVTIPGTGITLRKGLPLSVATSSYFMACQKDLTVSAGILGMGKSPVCLIDSDEDGVLDSWFRSSINVVWSAYTGHLQRDDIHPIGPILTRRLSTEEVRKLDLWSTFAIRYAQGMLTYCVGTSDVCLQKSPKIKPSGIEQTTEFMGGAFSYRKLEDGRLAVRMIRDPKEATF